jgi:hypothetical protein
MVMETKIAILLEAIQEIVAAEGTWQEKKNEILGSATEEDKTALYEFVAWFE